MLWDAGYMADTDDSRTRTSLAVGSLRGRPSSAHHTPLHLPLSQGWPYQGGHCSPLSLCLPYYFSCLSSVFFFPFTFLLFHPTQNFDI